MPTDAEMLADLRRLHDVATPGPWLKYDGNLFARTDADLELAVAMHNALPRLLAIAKERDKQEAALDRYRKGVARSIWCDCPLPYRETDTHHESCPVASATLVVTERDVMKRENERLRQALKLIATATTFEDGESPWVAFADETVSIAQAALSPPAAPKEG